MRHALALVALFAIGCGGELPTWKQPGLEGAVRPEMGGLQPGMAAPDFELPADASASVKLSSLRGSWLVLHFTASWCPYCDSEIAKLGEIADAYGVRGVKVVLVDEKESPEKWRAYASGHVRPSIVALRDEDGRAALRYAPPGAQPSFADRSQVALDATLLVDPDGVVRLFLLPDSAHFDPTFAAVRRELDRLLAADVVHVAFGAERHALVATLDVADGYHVMSHQPRAPEFVPTRIDVAIDGDALTPHYPAGATYAGRTRIDVPVEGARSGPHRVSATVSYQACTATRCLFPTTRHLETTVSFPENAP